MFFVCACKMSLLLSYGCESRIKQFIIASTPLPFFLAESYKPLSPCYDLGSCHWPLTVESLGNSQFRACVIVWGKMALAQVFLMVFRFFQSVLGP